MGHHHKKNKKKSLSEDKLLYRHYFQIVMLSHKLLCNNSKLDSCLNLTVKLCNSLELTKSLNRIYSDVLAVYLYALLKKCSCKVCSGDSTENLLLLCLCSECKVKVVDSLCQSLCISKDLCVLVSALTKILCEYLLCRCCSSLAKP